MTYQEKRSAVYLITTFLTIGIYGAIIYNKFQAGDFDTSNLMKFWAIRILWYIPIVIGVRIVTEILLNILQAISNEIKGEGQEDLGITDERDKLIELKADRVSMFVFAVGFVLALVTQVMDQSIHWFFLTMFGFGLVGEVISEGLKIRYYRKGV